MYAADVELGAGVSVRRRLLFPLPPPHAGLGRSRFYRNWDLAPDGYQFLFTHGQHGRERAVVIHNWASLVRQQRSGHAP